MILSKIRTAAEYLYILIQSGDDWETAEETIIREHNLDENDLERVTEVYCTEFAEDDG